RAPASLARLNRVPGVELRGWVESLTEAYGRATLAVAPLRVARGIQNKVLEALAAGVPVVASPAAARGLDQAGRRGRPPTAVAWTSREWAAVVARLAADPAERSRLAADGFDYLRRRHNRARTADVLRNFVLNHEGAVARPESSAA
ncbi:MAG: glycosyltransferase, partial [Planctomycetia bacterium]